jgi:hypothetical protein
LEQIFSLEEKQKWVEKMKGFDFEIIYKKGKDNVVKYVLSRISSILYSIISFIAMWLEETHHEWKNDNNTKQKIQCIKEGMNSMEYWE